ncbi:hypothetical protein HCN44_010467 [Aphidius gifuensis]|uniref:Glutaredoxin domain-containing protein n=1 Tax=Aphidius gifuensis TaxID=684658 RepID=A0A834XVP0_APHGI|nr:probable serine/threonine-protein kinase DDB_G0282963 [Aphidius gifuensis]KAF7991666.1 hypothetical protein HCN44_010467 [Aphidius gifuensis]
MSETRTMTLPSALSPQNNHHSSQIDRQRVSILAVAPTLSSDTSSEAGATVYIGGNAMKMDSTTWQSTITTTSLQSSNNTHTQQSTTNLNKTINDHNHHNYHHQQQQPAHVVKIKINPELEKNTRVISTVHLSSNENNNLIINQNNYNNKFNDSNIDSCVRISVLNKVNKKEEEKLQQQVEEQVELEIQEDEEEEEEKDIEESSDSQNLNRDEMIQQTVTNDTNRTCFYYGTLQNQIMSSGQCSPSDTLDSGTCSDLDCTSPSLLLLKKTTTINNNNSIKINKHIRSGSLTSSGADIDSDDNESSVSNDSLSSREFTKLNCINIINNNNNNNNDIDNNIIIDKMLEATADQLGHVTININDNNNDKDTFNSNNKNNNSDDNCCNDINDEIYNNNNNNNNIDDKNNEIIKDKYDIIDDSLSSCNSPSQSVTSTLSKSSSTPRVRSPNPLVNGQQQVQQQQQQQNSSPVVKECTYEERKQEKYKIDHDNAIAEKYNNYNRDKKFLYDDDRFYKFHINEFDKNNNGDLKKSINDCEIDEYFAGYKILDNKEAIRSAKGTVRGVKNRVRAGIATFLQNPSSKNYKQKDAGKIVVYTTSMRVVRKTAIACVKMMGILGTHMVDYEERNLFTSREFQTELKDRLGSETVEVPQLFIDGQYIGDADAVERLNESGELRPMLKPYKCPGKRQVCGFCGGAGAVPCIVCNGSKKSPKWNNFMNEFVALRCMKCDEVGLIRCQYCSAGDRS